MKSLRDILEIPILFSWYQRLIFRRQLLARHRVIEKELAPDPGQRVLDAGCGVVTHVAGGKTVGVDIHLPYLAYSRRKWNIPVLCADLRALPFKQEVFDKASSVMTLHHLDDAALVASLRESFQCIAASGNAPKRMFILDAVWPLQPWNFLGKILRRWDRGGHVRKLPEYRALLAAHYDILASYTFGVFPLDYVVFWLGERNPNGAKACAE